MSNTVKILLLALAAFLAWQYMKKKDKPEEDSPKEKGDSTGTKKDLQQGTKGQNLNFGNTQLKKDKMQGK